MQQEVGLLEPLTASGLLQWRAALGERVVVRLMVRAKHLGMVGWWGRGTWLAASSHHTSFPLQMNRYHPWGSREEGALSHKFKKSCNFRAQRTFKSLAPSF